MREIVLTKGYSALVDNEDYDWLNQWKWYATKVPNTYYGRRKKVINGKTKRILLHRFILDAPSNMEVDHIDRNGLNCQRHNLRLCTTSQNGMNRIKKTNTSSKYRGVSIHRVGKYSYWRACIRINKKPFEIGNFKNELDAAKAYDKYAIKHHKEFANLNFK